MSNRRRPGAIMQTLAALDGARIAGGCDHCDAYQTTRIDGPSLGRITVHHDEWFPWLRRLEKQR